MISMVSKVLVASEVLVSVKAPPRASLTWPKPWGKHSLRPSRSNYYAGMSSTRTRSTRDGGATNTPPPGHWQTGIRRSRSHTGSQHLPQGCHESQTTSSSAPSYLCCHDGNQRRWPSWQTAKGFITPYKSAISHTLEVPNVSVLIRHSYMCNIYYHHHRHYLLHSYYLLVLP